jgi:hypothetical protein
MCNREKVIKSAIATGIDFTTQQNPNNVKKLKKYNGFLTIEYGPSLIKVFVLNPSTYKDAHNLPKPPMITRANPTKLNANDCISVIGRV